MYVSVIIPVYNAESYLRAAVESALSQPETGEVILIEDNSPDNALQVCQQLVSEYEQVRLYQHPNGENRGAGASRNLGIQQATYPYIAFLDADDLYLEGRFRKDIQIMEANPEVDGVYNASKGWIDNSSEPHETTGKNDMVVTVSREIPSEMLFAALLNRQYGAFNTLSITVRRSLFDLTGLFDEHLELGQDTAMWLKMAAVGNLVAGEIDKPVSKYRVHPNNRSRGLPRDKLFARSRRVLVTVWFWCRDRGYKNKEILVFWRLLRILRESYKDEETAATIWHLVVRELSLYTLRRPGLLFTPYFIKDYLLQFPVIRKIRDAITR